MDSPSSFSWRAIASMLTKMTNRNVDGNALYKEFKRKFDANQNMFSNLVNNFDENGIVLKTDNTQDPAQGGDLDKSKAAVNSSAKRASSKLLNK